MKRMAFFYGVGAGRGRVNGGGLKGGVAPWKNKACQRKGDNTNSESFGEIVELKNVTLQLLKLIM